MNERGEQRAVPSGTAFFVGNKPTLIAIGVLVLFAHGEKLLCSQKATCDDWK